ncbi:hypothetical protein ACRYCC_41840 [Actinomadura scrupuli]|uniref:hypothetical protein n=1 Tax=Actinomadura scrupuli TaxID=559629 RepID=UPI003D986BBF
MVVFLGLVVVVVAMVIGVDVAVENTAPATLTVFGRTVPQVTTQGQVLLFGAGVTVVLVAGLVIVYFAMARALRLRRELRYLREEAEESITTLERQKRQLQRELAQARRDTGQAPVPAKTAGPPQATVVSSFFDPAR